MWYLIIPNGKFKNVLFTLIIKFQCSKRRICLDKLVFGNKHFFEVPITIMEGVTTNHYKVGACYFCTMCYFAISNAIYSI